MPVVRLLTAADVPAGMQLKDAAGWNQTATDWLNLLALAPEGCFGIDSDGALRATTSAVTYGNELAWIGMVLTGPAHRGRGFARRLMEHALEHLRGRSVGWIKLDATEMGIPLYRRLGFREEGKIERWLRLAGAVSPGRASVDRFAPDPVLDREAFGADRSRLLSLLARIESASIPGAGFAMGRPGSNAAYFGPCVARSAASARSLLEWFLEKHSAESVHWDILPANAGAVALAREFGFRRVRELARMALACRQDAAALGNHDSLVFATAGFEYG